MFMRYMFSTFVSKEEANSSDHLNKTCQFMVHLIKF